MRNVLIKHKKTERALLTKANQAQMWQARIIGYKQNPKKRKRTTNVTNEHKTKTEHILLT